MMHTMRCSPCANHPALAEYDNSVRKGICAITNLDLSDLQWLQASIPVKEGGLGVRRVTSLAPSAFLASAASTDVLQQQLLLHSPTVATADTAVSLAKNIWSSAALNSPLPTGLSAHKQSTWDKPVIGLELDKSQQSGRPSTAPSDNISPQW